MSSRVLSIIKARLRRDLLHVPDTFYLKQISFSVLRCYATPRPALDRDPSCSQASSLRVAPGNKLSQLYSSPARQSMERIWTKSKMAAEVLFTVGLADGCSEELNRVESNTASRKVDTFVVDSTKPQFASYSTTSSPLARHLVFSYG